MTSKEALEKLGNIEVAVTTIRSGITHFKTLKEQYEAEFEVLERELFIRKELKDFDVYQRQLEKLEKALDKACERLEYYTGNCPCGEELIEDLDCDECDNNCKECWKKFFMKEVLKNGR